eukprot:11095511-Prorocentrum_lima.AAC.1
MASSSKGRKRFTLEEVTAALCISAVDFENTLRRKQQEQEGKEEEPTPTFGKDPEDIIEDN